MDELNYPKPSPAPKKHHNFFLVLLLTTAIFLAVYAILVKFAGGF